MSEECTKKEFNKMLLVKNVTDIFCKVKDVPEADNFATCIYIPETHISFFL